MLRRVLLATAAFCAVSPTSALAVVYPTVTTGSGAYVFNGLGIDDVVTIAGVAGDKVSFTVTSSAGITTAVAGCTGDGTPTVTCPFNGTYYGVEAHGNGGADKITVSGGISTRFAYLYGEAGNDELTGNDENDYFDGGSGADKMDGGPAFPVPNGVKGYAPGSDYNPDSVLYDVVATKVTLSLDGMPNDGPEGDSDNVTNVETVETGSGNDVVDFSGAIGNVTAYTGDGDDKIIGGPGNDYLVGNKGGDDISGGAGDDRIMGDSTETPGNDRLDGGDGSDDITAGFGNDVEIGGAGDDSFNTSELPDYGTDDVSGGDGQDEAWVVRWQDDRFGSPTDETAGGGSMWVARSARIATPPVPQPVFVSLDDVANDGRQGETSNIHSDVEDIRTGDGDDTVVGSAAANTIITGLGNDTVTGAGGPDDVQVGSGNDTLELKDALADRGNCGPGSDTVSADEGVDALFSCESVTRTALPVPPPPVLPDTVKPTGRITGISAKGIKRKTFAKDGVKLTITTSEATKVAAKLYAALSTGKRFGFAAAVNDLQIGSGALKLGTGARKLTLKPGAKWKPRVRNRRLRLTVELTLTDAAGNVSVVTKKVRVT